MRQSEGFGDDNEGVIVKSDSSVTEADIIPRRGGGRCKQVLAGSTYLVTRRTREGRYLLRPDVATTELLYYAIGFGQQLSGVALHAIVATSNHVHEVLTDVRGALPDYTWAKNLVVGRVMKARHGVEDGTWARGGSRETRLVTPTAVVRRMGYVFCHPVKDGLVRSVDYWPGVKTPLKALCRSGQWERRVRRPPELGEGFPAEVVVRLTLPGFVEESGGAAALCARAEEYGRDYVADARAKRGFDGVLGLAAVMARGRFERPVKTLESERCPAVAADDPAAYRAAMTALRAFRDACAWCWQQFRLGDRSVSWPPGTWKYVVQFGCPGLAPDG